MAACADYSWLLWHGGGRVLKRNWRAHRRGAPNSCLGKEDKSWNCLWEVGGVGTSPEGWTGLQLGREVTQHATWKDGDSPFSAQNNSSKTPGPQLQPFPWQPAGLGELSPLPASGPTYSTKMRSLWNLEMMGHGRFDLSSGPLKGFTSVNVHCYCPRENTDITHSL